MAERDSGQMRVRLKETLLLGRKLADNIARSWRDNLGEVHLNALPLNGKSLLDLNGESFKKRFRLVRDRAVGREGLEIAESYDVAAKRHKDDSLENGILCVQSDKVQRLSRALFSSTAMRNENVLKMQRERKIWWMKVTFNEFIL